MEGRRSITARSLKFIEPLLSTTNEDKINNSNKNNNIICNNNNTKKDTVLLLPCTAGALEPVARAERHEGATKLLRTNNQRFFARTLLHAHGRRREDVLIPGSKAAKRADLELTWSKMLQIRGECFDMGTDIEHGIV